MKLAKVVDFMFDELEDAKKYAKCGAKAKAEGSEEMAMLALKLADIEMSHADMWHEQAMAIIKKNQEMLINNEYMKAYVDDMQYDYIQQVAKVKYMVEAAKK